MAAALTRFEVLIPITGTVLQQAAIDTFLDNLGSVCKFTSNMQFIYSSHDLSAGQYTQLIYGLVTTPQQATATGFFNTLAASVPGCVCTTFQVTQQ